jgi:hypothetical protein
MAFYYRFEDTIGIGACSACGRNGPENRLCLDCYESEGFVLGVCFACSHEGPVWEGCVWCERGRYLADGYGSCKECDNKGTVGDACSACEDDNQVGTIVAIAPRANLTARGSPRLNDSTPSTVTIPSNVLST